MSDRFMATVSLVSLVVQNVGFAMCTRYSRLLPGPPWINTTAVVCSEFTKFLASMMLIWQESGRKGLQHALRQILIDDIRSTCLMGVPGVLYVVQNNLYFIGLANLSVTVFQVTAQFKILTTAVLSVLMLSKSLGPDKWFALVLLTVGVVLIDCRGDTASKGVMAVGLAAVFTACCTSGFAGVYTEMMLKQSTYTIWERNLQLSAFGVLFGLLGVFSKDFATVSEGGFFQGYNYAVVMVVMLQALGGLVVAAVLKYADNLLKCFATAASLILASVLSPLVFGEGPELMEPTFIIGTTAVVLATTLYSLGWQGLVALCSNPMPSPAEKGSAAELPSVVNDAKPQTMGKGHAYELVGDEESAQEDARVK